MSNINVQTNPIHVISYQLIKWNTFNEYDIKQFNMDIEILSRLYFIILTQLRTGHIKLNWCLHQLQHSNYYRDQFQEYGCIQSTIYCTSECCKYNNSGFCHFCKNCRESVYHFIMVCPKYKRNRFLLYCEIMRILNQYQYEYNLKNILFPPMNIIRQHRKHIYDSLCYFVLSTRRIHFHAW